jgi:small conductance mechanosensitive channel
MGPEEIDTLSSLSEILNPGKMLALFIGIALLWGIVRFVNILSSSLGQKLPSKRLFILQVATILTFAIYIGGSIFLVYGIIKPPKELMIAFGGSAAVAIGLSLKDLVSSLIAGLILLFDRPFQVGDRVTFGDTYGEIQSIGLRAVRLVTLDDNLVTIPNSKFVTDAVASGNAGALDMMICVDFYLSPHCNIVKVKEIILEILVTSRYVYLKKPVAVVATEKMFAEILTVEMKAKAYVLDVKYEKAFQTDIVARVEEAFNELNIERPSRSYSKTNHI